jgi:hypothetical protein
MTWVRIDDHFDEHPKLAEAGVVCWGVWLAALAYCNRNLTDGFIPWTVARGLGSWEVLDVEMEEGRRRVWEIGRATGMHGEDMDTEWVIERLVAVGLWEQVDGGFRVHDYTDYQPTKAEVLAERAKTKERVADWRKRKKGNGVSNGSGKPVSNDVGTPSPVPGPAPVPEVLSKVLSTPAHDELDWIDPAAFFEERTKRKASQKVRDWLEDLHARFSRTELIAAMRAVSNPRESDWLKKVDAYLEGKAA